MFAEFEKIVHEKIENGETLSSEDLNSIYYKLNQKYFGEDVFIDEEIKYEWARIPHFIVISMYINTQQAFQLQLQ